MAAAPAKTATVLPDQKRKAEAETAFFPEIVQKDHVQRKYDLDTDMLECPIYLEQFSPPVYQVCI